MTIIASPNFGGVSLDQIELSLTDTFGRLKTSEPAKVAGFSQDTPLRSRLIDEGQLSGTGTTATFNADSSTTTLSVTGNNIGKRRLKTLVAGLYQPGKALTVLNTFNFGGNSGNVSWVEKSGVTGSPVETEVLQANWNVDPMNGTGESGIALDWTKSQLSFTSFAWLGVGLVVCGFIVDGRLFIAHIFSHVNTLGTSNPTYIKTARLFPTFDIEQTSTDTIKEVGYGWGNDCICLRQKYTKPGTTQSLIAICSSVLSDGAIDQVAETYPIHRTTETTFNTESKNSTRILALFRLNPSSINGRVKVIDYLASISSNAYYYAFLVRDPVITGHTPTWTDYPGSSVQYDLTAPETAEITNYFGNSFDIAGGNTTSDTAGGQISIFNYLGSKFDGTPITYALAVRSDTNSETVRLAYIKLAEDL
jgi:hypothetical protein